MMAVSRTQITVRPECARQKDVQRLMRLSDEIAKALYPENGRHQFDPEEFAATKGVMIVARTNDGTLTGCCILQLMADNTGELKRLIVNPRFRKLGVGKAIVASACDLAQENGLDAVQLEVGTKNVAAQVMYQNAGFQDRGPFGHHKTSVASRFMEYVIK